MAPALQPGEVYSVIDADSFLTNQIAAYYPPKKFRMDDPDVIWVHRLIAVPGDIIEMKKGVLFLNGRTYPFRIDLRHSYRVKTKMPLAEKKIEALEYHILSFNEYNFNATRDEIATLKENPAVLSVSPGVYDGEEDESNALRITGRNRDNWGPVQVPKRGDHILITEHNIRQYETIMTEYEGQPVPSVGTAHVVEKDYYFVLGDNRHNALDSRYTGFIPYDQMAGIMIDPLEGLSSE